MDNHELFIKLLGKHIRNIRDSKGPSREEIAEDAEIIPNNLGRNERGEAEPTSYTLYKLYHRLGFSLDRVFKEIKLEIEAAQEESSDKEKK